ncbi:MAG: ribonuclease R [Calditrichia bacterium]
MAKKKPSKIKRDIYRFLKQHPDTYFKRKEISAALGVHKSTYHQFKKALGELIDEGKLAKIKGGRIGIAVATPTVIGKLNMSKNGYGFVYDEATEKDIFIPPSKIGTAFDGDEVEVKLAAVRRGKNLEGAVQQVVKREKTNFAGTFHKSKYYSFVVPDSQKIHKDFYIPKGQDLDAKDGQKVIVELTSWPKSSLNPEAKVVEILGYADEKGVDVSMVMVDHGLPRKFPAKVEMEAEAIPVRIEPKEIQKRLDLRDEFIFTIDPVDAKDFDDAVSLEKNDKGNWILGVHIADVSHYVGEHTILDKEAFMRGTSVYMVDRVVPMLPEKLSNKVCSLRPNEDKLTFSCIMEIDSALQVVSYQIKPSVIRSKQRLNYEEAQGIIEDRDNQSAITLKLREMNDLAKGLRAKRLNEGGLDFFTPEVKFVLDDSGFPVEIVPVKQLETHQLIEEFMLMANKTVANHVDKISPKNVSLPFIYRIHEKPDKEKFQKFSNMLKILGYSFRIPRNPNPFFFQEVFKAVKGSKDEIIVQQVALRTMMKAIYSTRNEGHFGLGFSHYTHFTSPIRRYPDLIVHRLLKEYTDLPGKSRIQSLKNQLKKAAEHSTERERVAMEAERQSIKIKQVQWISRHVGEIFDGIVNGVASYGVFVEIDTYLIEGMVHINNMLDDIYIYEEETYSLIGRNTGKIYRLGDPVKIEVYRVDLDKNIVDFVFVEDQSSINEDIG